MKKQIRRGVFETNSSSVHSLTLCMESDYDRWDKDGLFLFTGSGWCYPDENKPEKNHFYTKDEVIAFEKSSKYAPDKDFKDSDLGLIEDIKNSSYLSTEEKEYCTCVIQGVDTSKEISQMMNLNQRMPLKRPLISSLISIDEDTKKMLEEKATVKNIKKIKDSLKRKMDAYNKEGINIFRD